MKKSLLLSSLAAALSVSNDRYLEAGSPRDTSNWKKPKTVRSKPPKKNKRGKK